MPHSVPRQLMLESCFNPLIAAKSFDPALLILLAVTVSVLLTAMAIHAITRHRRGIISARKLFRKFFGDTYWELLGHEKKFPGYDLASLHRAIESFIQDCSIATPKPVGSPNHQDLCGLLHNLRELGGSCGDTS